MMDIQEFIQQCEAKLERAEERRQRRLPTPRKRPAKCGAFARSTGEPCNRKALANGRCRNHGGMSTGPKTAGGKAKALANLKQFQLAKE